MAGLSGRTTIWTASRRSWKQDVAHPPEWCSTTTPFIRTSIGAHSFLCDSSEGRILAARLNPEGASYQTNVEVFLKGEPLNVTDIEVGPDGHLYFVTGGRGTQGGL